VSQEKVATVERLIAGFNRRDDDWQAALAELTPDVEVNDLDISLDTETFRGHEGCRDWVAAWGDAWGDWRITELEVRLPDDDRAIALFVMVVTGKESGIELSRRDAMVYTLRAGKVAKLTYFNDQEQALKAVGLEE
jgi:ketosteroid isomerase-like protein